MSDDGSDVADEEESGGVPELLARIEGLEGEAVENLDDLAVNLRRLLELSRRGSFSGPLPPPEILEGYKAAYPDAPRIVFDELTKQGTHRRDLETHAIQAQEKRADRGQIFALVISLAALALGGVAVLTDQGWVAVALFGSTLVSIIGLFIYGSRRQTQDLTRKRERLQRALPPGPDDEDDE